MTIYLLNLFSIPCYALLFQYVVRSDKKRSLFLCYIVGFQLFVTAAMRAITVGGDLENYIPAFAYISGLSWGEVLYYSWEPGYVLLNKLLSVISDNERILLVCVGLIVVWGYVRFIRFHSTCVWLSLFLLVGLGYYIGSLSMLRQSIAIVCVLNSVQYIEQTNFKKFCLSVVIASLFHFTALVFFLLYPLCRFKISIGFFVSVLIFAFLFSVFAGNFFILYLIENYYSIYENKVVSGEGYNMFLLLVAVTFGGLLLRWCNHVRDKKFDIFFHMMISACCLQFLSMQFSLFARIVLYFQIGIIIFIPNVLNYIRNKEIVFWSKVFICGLVTCYLIWIYLANNSSGILPYYFFWEIS